MRSSRDVLNRLLHDDSLNLAQDTYVGYLDRFKGSMELSLPKFAAGDIPMHRVLYFRNGSEVIWHKETRLDLVYSSSDASRAHTEESVQKRRTDVKQAERNRLEMEKAKLVENYSSRSNRFGHVAVFSELQNIPVHRHSVLSGNWVSFRSCSGTTSCAVEGECSHSTLRVATFNVLQDTFLPEVLKQMNELRWGSILEHVKHQNAHIWVFTEATPSFAKHILSDQFVRNQYFSSDSPSLDFRTLSGVLGATGQLVLIRRDLSVGDIFYTTTPLSTGKRLMFVSVTLPSGTKAIVCGLHLTSGQVDRADSAPAIEKRRKQLEFVVSKMNKFVNGFDVHVIVGDFNFKSEKDEDANTKILKFYSEADYNFLAPTYDTARNGLALLNAEKPKSMRLDRVYLRNVSNRFATSAQSHDILGEDSIQGVERYDSLAHLLPSGLQASDHFGVVTTFQLGGNASPPIVLQKRWTKSTALALLLDTALEKEINSIWRDEYDPASKKWPAHVNILYPFVNEDCLDEVCSSLQDALFIHGKRLPEHVSMEMNDVQTFKHRSSCTVYLKPADDAIIILQDLLFKTCVDIVGEPNEFAGRQKQRYTPHMTIAKLKDTEGQTISQFLSKAKADLLNNLNSLRATRIRSLSVLRMINGRMVTTDLISLPKRVGTTPMKPKS